MIQRTVSLLGLLAVLSLTALPAAAQSATPATGPAPDNAASQAPATGAAPQRATGELLASDVPASQPAPPEVTAAIAASVEQWTQGQFKIEGVRTTPLADLFEVQIRTDLFYTDRTGRYLLIEGELVDMQTNVNLTRLRMADVLAIDFADLPLAKSIKQVNGDGKRIVALFEDPNCGYCRRLRADLMKIDNLTIYTFAYPILAADSDVKSRKALCAADPSKAWNDLMLTGTVPDNDGSCETPLEEIISVGRRFGISATPTVFFPSGHRLQGYAPPERFVELLETNQAAKPKS